LGEAAGKGIKSFGMQALQAKMMGFVHPVAVEQLSYSCDLHKIWPVKTR